MSVDANGNIYPYFYGNTHTVPEGNKHTTVRLTREAHTLLTTKAKKSNVSMKTIASEAIFMLDRTPKAEKMFREHIEQLKFQAKKSKQIAIFQMLMASLGGGILGFIAGVMVV